MTYKTLNHIFPRSFALKVLFVAFVGTHIPLIALTVYFTTHASAFQSSSSILVLALVATLAGTILTILTLKRLMRPINDVIAALHGFEESGQSSELAEHHRDEIGYLMQATNRLTKLAAARMKQLQAASETDWLTGALNRRGFVQHAAAFQAGSLLHFDIDDFKSINDKFGHAKGDLVLQTITQRILHKLPSSAVFGRIGGEEYAVLLTDNVDENSVAQSLLNVVSSMEVDNVHVSISVGISPYQGNITTALRHADKQTYFAKANGKNCFSVDYNVRGRGFQPPAAKKLNAPLAL